MLTRSPSLLAEKIAKGSMCNPQISAYVLLAPLSMNYTGWQQQAVRTLKPKLPPNG